MAAGPEQPARSPRAEASERSASPDDGPAPRRISWRSAGVVTVALLAGMLFATNASLFRGEESRSPTNLVELARAEGERLEANEEHVSELRERTAAIIEELETGAEPDAEVDDLVSLAAGRTGVTGPGIVVEMWDAPAPSDLSASGLQADDLVVHQQDLEAVINALWSGGAEALMIQDQRISATSSVRCVGNVLLLHGRHYSPPYRISAIGDPDHLTDSVMASRGVQVYLQYVDAIKLGWSLESHDELEMPAYRGSTRMEHVRVPVAYASPDSVS